MRVFIMSTRENLLGVDRTQVDDEIFVFHIIGRRLNSWRFSVCNILSPIIHTHIVYHPYVSFESSHYHPGPISSLHLIFQFSSIIGFFFALVFFFSFFEDGILSIFTSSNYTEIRAYVFLATHLHTEDLVR